MKQQSEFVFEVNESEYEWLQNHEGWQLIAANSHNITTMWKAQRCVKQMLKQQRDRGDTTNAMIFRVSRVQYDAVCKDIWNTKRQLPPKLNRPTMTMSYEEFLDQINYAPMWVGDAIMLMVDRVEFTDPKLAVLFKLTFA